LQLRRHQDGKHGCLTMCVFLPSGRYGEGTFSWDTAYYIRGQFSTQGIMPMLCCRLAKLFRVKSHLCYPVDHPVGKFLCVIGWAGGSSSTIQKFLENLSFPATPSPRASVSFCGTQIFFQSNAQQTIPPLLRKAFIYLHRVELED
jgi:hypothetical protein